MPTGDRVNDEVFTALMQTRIGKRRTLMRSDEYSDRRADLKQRVPYISLTWSPEDGRRVDDPAGVIEVATYNVHRWTGLAGGRRWNPHLASKVIGELDADIIALQEVLVPFDGENPLTALAKELGMHLTFVSTRIHRFGELGNAILSGWPLSSVFTIDLTLSRLERRSALAAEIGSSERPVSVVSTHLALFDRTRRRQVKSLLGSEKLHGPAVLLGDMNAWRRCSATRSLEDAFTTMHHNLDWPSSFPSTRPVLALDRIYTRGAHITELRAHNSEAARRASDHLPIVATIRLNGVD